MNRTPIRRGKPLPRKNAKRRKSEFARAYGSVERVAFVKSLPCAALRVDGVCDGPIENAHTMTDGMGRKAGYDMIAPLCRKHHRNYDEHRGILAYPWARHLVITAAAETERLWSEWQTRTETEDTQ